MLTASEVKNAKPKAKPYKLADGRGLYLLVTPSGGRLWRLKYRRPGTHKENTLALGIYPDVSLHKARERLQAARDLLADGIDPSNARKASDKAKAKAAQHDAATFAVYARKWFALKAPGWSESSVAKARLILDRHLVPALGERPVADITTPEVVVLVRRIAADTPVIARRVAGTAKAVIRLAISEGARPEGHLLDLNLRDNLAKANTGHFAAAVNPTDVAVTMRTIKDMNSPVTRAALLVCAYTAQRPGNVAAMRWEDVDMDAAEWIIPAEAMKMRQSHVVPLSRQVLAAIASMRELTGGIGYVFPPLAQQGNAHLHRDAMSKALRRAGLGGKQTPHGLRATFRTVARERLGASADVLEAQLAHAKQGPLGDAYDRAGFLDERRTLVQRWADYLDGTLLDNVTPIRGRA